MALCVQAVDLSWDIMVRLFFLSFPFFLLTWGHQVRFQDRESLPAEFYTDWLKVAGDEAKVRRLFVFCKINLMLL